MRSQELYSNKSGLLDKKPANLVVQTQLHNAFDNRWAELKIQGKNVPSRSNHVTVVFGEKMYVHGGYDVDKGILGDFYEMDLSPTCEEFTWKKLTTCVRENKSSSKVTLESTTRRTCTCLEAKGAPI